MLAREFLGMIPYISPDQARSFQELFIDARRRMGLTQIQAAELAGVSQTLISTVERGPHVGMRVFDLLKILRAYKIEPNRVGEVLGMLPEREEHRPATSSRLSQTWAAIEMLDETKLGQFLDIVDVVLAGLHAH